MKNKENSGSEESASWIDDELFIRQPLAEASGTDRKELKREFDALLKNLKGIGSEDEEIKSIAESATLAIQANDPINVNESLKKLVEHREVFVSIVNEADTPKLDRLIRQTSPEFIDDERRSRIIPWKRLDPEIFTLNREKIGDHEIKDTLRLLQLYGISLLRISGQYPSEEFLRGYFELLGQVAGSQNDFPDEIKTIRPSPEVNPNTGDSALDLGFHVDGTQAFDQPAILVFQYVKTADFGGNSRFVDLAGVLKDIHERDQILSSLSRSDAAQFEKKGMAHNGPIFSFPDGHSLAGRLRYDSVIKIHDDIASDFVVLREAIREGYEITFKPHPGDIIVFDNWRVMHARSEIFGEGQRVHRRVWLNALNTEYQDKFFLGIRPLSAKLAAKIEEMNNS